MNRTSHKWIQQQGVQLQRQKEDQELQDFRVKNENYFKAKN